MSKVAAAVVSVLASLAPTTLMLYVTGVPYLVSRLTIRPRYLIKVAVFTVLAKITGRSYVVRTPGQPPRFIARSSCKDVHTFTLTDDDIHHIYVQVGIHARTYLERRWRPDWRVRRYLGHSVFPDAQDPPADVDLSSYRLVGPRLTQGQGLIGHNVHLALIEEYGRWPKENRSIAGKAFSWTGSNLVQVKFPTHFVTSPGVQETVDIGEVRITVEWQDLEAGISRGLRVSGITIDPPRDS